MTKAEIEKYNRDLIKKYPFLKPKNAWTGLDIPDYDYLYTNADDIPLGWRAAFGDLLIEEINQELIKNKFVDKYQIIQIKEKYGELRWYDNGIPIGSSIHSITDKYETLSRNICILCGKPDVPILPLGWVSPYCLDCCNKHDLLSEKEYNKLIKENNYVMSDARTIQMYDISKDCWVTETMDMSDTASLIRQRWEDGTIRKRYDFFSELYKGGKEL